MPDSIPTAVKLVLVAVACLVVGAVFLAPALGTDAAPGTSAADGSPVPVGAEAATPNTARPAYAEDGALLRPERWEEWVLVGTSMGLSYSEGNPAAERGPDDPPGMFHNVLMPGWALERYREEGVFPDETMLALAIYDVGTSAPPRERGFYQGELVALELHVKDADRFEAGWGFFGFDADPADDRSDVVPSEASCYSCHAEHAATDDVFTQFYPLLPAP